MNEPVTCTAQEYERFEKLEQLVMAMLAGKRMDGKLLSAYRIPLEMLIKETA